MGGPQRHGPLSSGIPQHHQCQTLKQAIIIYASLLENVVPGFVNLILFIGLRPHGQVRCVCAAKHANDFPQQMMGGAHESRAVPEFMLLISI